jgi:hypothetical protein
VIYWLYVSIGAVLVVRLIVMIHCWLMHPRVLLHDVTAEWCPVCKTERWL